MRKMTRFILTAGLLLAMTASVFGQPKHGRGYKSPPPDVLKERHDAAARRHGNRMKFLPRVTVTSYDLRTLGCVPPVKDQGSCGSCYQFGGADTCEIAMMKGGIIPVDGGGLAEQYGMSCQNWGGCNGGDEYDVIAWCKSNGLPLTSDYGPYLARSTACALKAGTKMWQIADFGYVDAAQQGNKPTVAEMKTALVTFGPVSIAIDAGSFDNYNGGVTTVTGNNIDHAVMIIGFMDDASSAGGGYWILRNQWSTSWGEQGYMKLSYASSFVECIWVSVTALPPPPPAAAPVVTGGSAAGVVGQPFSFQIAATNSPTSYTATALPAGLTVSATSGLISGTPTALGAFSVTISAANAAGSGSAVLALNVTQTPVPSITPTVTLPQDTRAGTYELAPQGTISAAKALTDILAASGALIPVDTSKDAELKLLKKQTAELKKQVDELLKIIQLQKQLIPAPKQKTSLPRFDSPVAARSPRLSRADLSPSPLRQYGCGLSTAL